MSGPMGGRGGNAAALPNTKSLNFGPSALRLLAQMKPERVKVGIVIALAIVSVVLSVVSPKVLGNATNEIFEGFMGKQTGQIVEPLVAQGAFGPEVTEVSDVTDKQVVELMRQLADSPEQLEAINQAMQAADPDAETLTAESLRQQADMLASMDFVPGVGIDFTQLGWILLAVIALYLVSSIFNWAQGYLLAGVVQRTMRRLREDIELKINRLPLSYFDRQTRGEVLSRVTNDIDNVGQSLQQTMSQLMVSLLTVVGVLVMMLTISWQLSLVALVTIPVAIAIAAFIMSRSQKQFVAQWKWTGELNSHIEEMYTGRAIVKVFGRQHDSEVEFRRRNEEMYQASFKAQFISGTIQPSMMLVTNLNYVIIAVMGGLKVASGSMSLGDVQAFIQYSRQFTQPITQIASQLNQLQSGVASAERVFELLDATEESADPSEPIELDRIDGRVTFEDVSFRYEEDKPLIEDLSLYAEPGQQVAIVGPTGAGKTTLVNLLMRFYEVDGGRITLDGHDIRDLTRDGLRSRIGMVLQDTWLFEGTIRENIAYGSLDASEEQIQEAAKATYVDRFVRTLPDGYDTIIDDDGTSVSSGEKQLLTIARAFLADPAILILDEATSSVDTRTEVLIQDAMNKLREGRTSFVIAHRLSTIRNADLILVMEHGKIVEKGTHESLMAKQGAYFALYNSQFADDEDAA